MGLLAFRSQFSEDEGIGNHVVDSVAKMNAFGLIVTRGKIVISLSVGEVIQGSLLVNDTDGGFLGADPDALNVVGSLAKGL